MPVCRLSPASPWTCCPEHPAGARPGAAVANGRRRAGSRRSVIAAWIASCGRGRGAEEDLGTLRRNYLVNNGLCKASPFSPLCVGWGRQAKLMIFLGACPPGGIMASSLIRYGVAAASASPARNGGRKRGKSTWRPLLHGGTLLLGVRKSLIGLQERCHARMQLQQEGNLLHPNEVPRWSDSLQRGLPDLWRECEKMAWECGPS